MAITYPQEVPIKWFDWTQRTEQAQQYPSQIADFRGDFMGQFNDATFDSHRVLLLDEDFAAVGELTGDEITVSTIDALNVYTFTVDWSDYYALNDLAYLAVVDANLNKYFQNYLPNGDFQTTDNWTLGSDTVISTGSMIYNPGSSSTSTTTYDLPLKVGSEYTITASVTYGGAMGGTFTIKDGSTTIASTTSSGTVSGTATITDGTLTLDFAVDGTTTITVNSITVTMSESDVVPEWISAPFCIKDAQETTFTIHGCANNDYFNMYFETTGFVPRILVDAELRESQPTQDIESYFGTSGSVRNYFVQHVSQKQLRIDWMPAYLANFLSVVFYLDNAQIENEQYTAIEPVEYIVDDNLPNEIAINAVIARKSGSVSYKRIENDPDAASCTIPSGAYISQNDGTVYEQLSTGETYYPQ